MIARTDDTAHELMPVNTAIRDVINDNANPTKIWRWTTRGLAGTNGTRIRLKVWFVGRKQYTTRNAVREFMDAVTAARMSRVAGTE